MRGRAARRASGRVFRSGFAMIPIDASTLYAIAPRFSGANHARQTAIISALAPHLSRVLAEYGITTRLRVAHWLAQICHESAGLRTTEEDRKSTRLNSSHVAISYAVFCLKKKK